MDNKTGQWAIMIGFSVLTLTGCSGVKDKLGLSRHTPDEFMVMKRAPLEVPQNMTALPTPQPGAQRPQETPATTLAKEAVIGKEKVTRADSQSSSERVLLQKTGANATQGNIRSLVNKEAEEEKEDKRPVVKRLLNMGSDLPQATVVDPAAEAERIQTNKKTGKPVTEGETPTVDE
ncbi:MAG TPA: DUF3035 domain-containing protein [Alphaproteobacteria bacterium]|nr:DUF3035 domain-containing protein [Alphaproteobacteria bacterium]HNS43814.1 DUF3035 domain-containing protein [Alphaproteobacteria bacterium]